METRFDGHSGHGGASNGDGGASVTAVDKRSNQPVIENHGNKAKLELHRARAKAHWRVLATTAQARWWRCRPQGRKARTAGSRWSQASRVGLLGAQGTDEAVASYATTGNAPRRRQKLNGAKVAATGKAEEEKRRTAAMLWL